MATKWFEEFFEGYMQYLHSESRQIPPYKDSGNYFLQEHTLHCSGTGCFGKRAESINKKGITIP